jgi:hypothetical protein
VVKKAVQGFPVPPNVVGEPGLEPGTSPLSAGCSNQLSYSPTRGKTVPSPFLKGQARTAP